MGDVAPCDWKVTFTGKGRKGPFKDVCRHAGTEKRFRAFAWT